MTLSTAIRVFAGYDELPDSYQALLAQAQQHSFFLSRPWVEYLTADAPAEQGLFSIYGIENLNSGEPLLMVPMIFTRTDNAVNGAHTLVSVGHEENYAELCLNFAEHVVDESFKRSLLTRLFTALRTGSDFDDFKIDVLRLCPVEMGGSSEALVGGALQDAGYRCQLYENSYNQYEVVSGLSYDAYFETRSSNHRYNVRRRTRNLAKEGEVEYLLCTDNTDAGKFRRALDGYIISSVESWKQPDSMVAGDMLELIQCAAYYGIARLGVLYLDGRPIASQFWIVSGGTANCVRLGYSELYRKDAPGVVLTDFIVRHLLDDDAVDCIDFGYGDEEYKSRWARHSRHYAGFMAFNPGTVRGRLLASKHILGQKVKRTVKAALRMS